MADEIQTVTISSGANVATKTIKSNGDSKDGELVFHSGCYNWTVIQY